MSAPAVRNDFAQKLRPLNAEQWSAWRLGERESDPVPPIGPDTLDDAVRQALHKLAVQPGDILAVQYTHAGLRKHTLWQFAVKRSTKRYRWRPATDGGKPVKVHELEPKLIAQTALAAPLAPVERFDAFRDDAVGRDLTLVVAP